MSKKRYGHEQIINKLREVEIMLSKGSTIGEASKRIGVTEQTYYRWRKQYGGIKIEQSRRLKGLEKENSRIKKLVADLSLHNRSPKGRQEAKRVLGHFESFLDGYHPTVDPATGFLARYQNRKPAALLGRC
jgi:transposase-like protein